MKKDLLDWHSATLTAATKIDANYKNTQNVRRFFKKQLGESFKFDRSFMKFLKESTGITLLDAVTYWKNLHTKL